jgi:lipopolysaccharide/colanic/teichoic acid biosynthesis glycosyltransferase
VYDESPAYDELLLTPEQDTAKPEGIYSSNDPPSITARTGSWRYLYVKRAFDLLCSTALMIACAIPGLLIATAVFLTSEGPILYTEERIGRNGRCFRIYKFRSMHWSAPRLRLVAGTRPHGVAPEWRTRKHLSDPRVTTVGRFLRRWSLDELPQFVNVLRGEMSLIGPRPIVMAETALYGDLLLFYLAATPGMSGLWQVSGRSVVGYEGRARLDAVYVRSWSLRTDLDILLRTLPAVLSRIGAR